MHTTAIVLEAPHRLSLKQLDLPQLSSGQVAVEVVWSGISTGTERLLWDGQMPHFPGLGYPLVPGYESIGRVTHWADDVPEMRERLVFVPGARCYGEIRGLFGGAASRMVVDANRIIPIDDELGSDGVLLALAATAHHAIAHPMSAHPDLIIGHGVLGRLLARITIASGSPAPVVWETEPARQHGADGYTVIDPGDDDRRDYHAIYDVSGDAGLTDELITRLAPGGELVLAGFYSQPIQFDFPAAFMREARLRIAAEWQPHDLRAASRLISEGKLDLGGLVTHTSHASDSANAYRTAFEDPECLKMILNWRAA